MLESFDHSRFQPLEESVTSLVRIVEDWCSHTGPTDDVSLLAMEVV
jgi:hypothetical protein